MLKYQALSVLTCLLLISTVAPTSSANETMAEDYVAFGGGSSEAYVGMIYNGLVPQLDICADQCVGGAWFSSLSAYTNVFVVPNDEFSATNAPIQLCLIHKSVTFGPPAQSYCQDPTIGHALATSTSFSFDEISVFVFEVYVDHDLGTGFGTSGELVATFF